VFVLVEDREMNFLLDVIDVPTFVRSGQVRWSGSVKPVVLDAGRVWYVPIMFITGSVRKGEVTTVAGVLGFGFCFLGRDRQRSLYGYREDGKGNDIAWKGMAWHNIA
jgi:hypothetical protein